jgi:predicted RNA-binding protein with PUA-like domain
MKHPGDRSLEGYQEPKRQKGRGDWTLEDYRRNGKLPRPEALARIQEREQPADHPHTLKIA